MGQEIAEHHFRHRDFERFDSRLAVETDLLCDWISEGVLARSAPMAGLELEAWLVQEDGTPAPRNAEFLARLADPAVVHELARFNVELNVAPQSLTDTGLRRMSDELETTCRVARMAPLIEKLPATSRSDSTRATCRSFSPAAPGSTAATRSRSGSSTTAPHTVAPIRPAAPNTPTLTMAEVWPARVGRPSRLATLRSVCLI